MRRPLIPVLTGALLAAGVACAPAPQVRSEQPSVPESVPQHLVDQWPRGRSFVAIAITDTRTDEDLFVDAPVAVTFGEPFTLSASAGCNTIEVTARSVGDRLVADSVVTTDAACPGVPGEAEQWLLGFFGTQPAWYTAADEVVLQTFAARVHLRAPDALRALPEGWPLGRSFRSVSVTQDGKPKPLVPDTGIFIRLTRAPDDLVVSAGCNTMGVRLRFDGQRLFIDEVRSTMMGCHEDRTAQDRWVYAFFDSGPTWTFDGEELVLRSGGTEIRLHEA